MSGLDNFYDDLQDQHLMDFDGDDDGSEYLDAMDSLFDVIDEDDDDDYESDGDDDFDPDVNMDEDDEDEDESEGEDGSPMFVVNAEEDDDDDVQEVTVDPAHFLQLISLFNSGGSADARAQLLSRVLNGSGGGAFRFAPPRSAGERAAERRKRRWWKPQTEPHPNGVALLRSGDFGPTGPWHPSGKHTPRPSERHAWRTARARAARRPLAEPTIPNTPGTVVAEYPSVPYVGQFCGPDYGVFYTATQRFTLYMYNTSTPKHEKWRQLRGGGTQVVTGGQPGIVNESDHDTDEEEEAGDWRQGGRWNRGPRSATSMHEIKAVDGIQGRWTITDADADRGGNRMIYSSITPQVHMLKTDEHDTDHTTLDFRERGHDHFGIWSIRFSADGKEVVAGASSGSIMVYDIAAERRTLSVGGHQDDVNAVCFADESSTNILVSGSDDGYVKVWDRRSLSSSTPSGVLAGATEGITYTSPKGDGRYIVVNSKDQAARLYDLRQMRSWSEFEMEPDAVSRWGQAHFDYRGDRYRQPKRLAHPRDCSVMTYRGHSVLRTLIRCHFSPVESTGQSYIYSGSADGLIHIWSLDGRVVQVLNRAESVPLRNARGGFNDPSAVEPAGTARSHRLGADAYEMAGLNWTVRDVAWHGYEPTLMSTCWEVEGRYRDGGSVAKHEWKGLGKGGLKSLEDWVDKAVQEAER